MALNKAIEIIKLEIAERRVKSQNPLTRNFIMDEEMESLEEALSILESGNGINETLSAADVIQSLILLKNYHEKNSNIVCMANINIKLSEIEESLLKYKLS